jgi:hypothetical protein
MNEPITRFASTGCEDGVIAQGSTVRICRPAFQDARRLLSRMDDRAKLRRQAMKLRYWQPMEDAVFDLRWKWIDALREEQVAELHIDDVLGRRSHLRVVFWLPTDGEPDRHIWVLAVTDKVAEYSTTDIKILASRRIVVRERTARHQDLSWLQV